jgi:aminoglycoside phosphotransferase (APT) family kinase protein
MLADALKSLHQVINPDKIPSVLENKMLSNGKYDPIIIWRKFYLPALNSVGCNSKSIAEKIFEKLTLVIGNIRPPCLIHGDLHYGNVVVLDEKVKIFDWSNGSAVVATLHTNPAFLLQLQKAKYEFAKQQN